MQDYQTYYEGKTILVTGGAGSIGTNLVRTLAELKAKQVIILDDLSAAYEWNIPSLPNVLFVKGLRPWIALIRFGPVVNNSLLAVAIVANLNR